MNKNGLQSLAIATITLLPTIYLNDESTLIFVPVCMQQITADTCRLIRTHIQEVTKYFFITNGKAKCD